MAVRLYSRTEDMFNQLTNETDFHTDALQQLLQIYQATNGRQKTVDVAEHLMKLGKDKRHVEIVHFYYGLTLQHMTGDDLDHVITLLKRGRRQIKTTPAYP